MPQNLFMKAVNLSDYEEFGRNAKEKILALISKEGITLSTSFNYSLHEKFSLVTEETNSGEKSVSIVTPQFSDLTELEQAIYLAHELGHLYVIRGRNKFLDNIYPSSIKWFKYLEEKEAWSQAWLILVQENIIDEEGDEFQLKAYFVYQKLKNKCLSSYGEHPAVDFPIQAFKASGKIIWMIVQSYVSAFFLIGLFLIFLKNDIPIPFIELTLEETNNMIGMKEPSFYKLVSSVASLIIAARLVLFSCKLTLSRIIN